MTTAAIWMAVLGGPTAGGVFTDARVGQEAARWATTESLRPESRLARESAAAGPAAARRGDETTCGPSRNIESLERQQLEALRTSPSLLPDRRESTLFGHPARTDPLYDEVRSDWDQQHYERPEYVQPVYQMPNVEKPLIGVDPIRRPVADRPFYVLPNDNKPNNNLKYYAAPGYDRPTTPSPVPRGPNYVIQPEFAPAYGHPTYGNPFYDRPERLGPTYEPQEYAPPRNRPPDYVAPPQ